MTPTIVHRCSPEGKLALRGFVGGTAAVLTGLALAVTGEIGAPVVVVLAGLVLSAGGVFGIVTALTTRYEIDSFDLVLWAGPFRRVIRLEEIEGVMPFHHPLPFPPRTLDRLAVAYKRDGVPRLAHLTPADPRRFLEDLVERSPFLERRGDHLVRKPALNLAE